MMKEGTYIIKTNQYEFLMTIYEYEGIYRIRYGDPTNKEGPCIDFTYHTNSPTKLKLENLMYKNICSKDGNMKKGEGTIHMLKSAIMLLCNNFPKIKRIVFNDVASIECKGRSLLLAHIYLPCYGKTWYSKHFNANPTQKPLKHLIEAFNIELNKPQTTQAFKSIPLTTEPNPNQTCMEYFYTKKTDCKFFAEIEDEIIKHFPIPLSYSEWYISSKSCKEWTQDITTLSYKQKSTPTGGEPWNAPRGHLVE